MINQASRKIHERAVLRAKNLRKSEIDLIDSLAEVEQDKTYLKFDRTSLYQYAIDFLFLSEDRALTLIAVMRKARAIPELKAALKCGAITASKAKKIVPVITNENKDLWLELAMTSTSRVIEKAVAIENPKLATKESLKYKTEDRLELVIGVSEEWEKLLKSVQNVASQKAGKAVDREEALKLAMECYLEKHDPLAKAKRARARTEKKLETSKQSVQIEPPQYFSSRDELTRQPANELSAKSLSKKLPVPGPIKRTSLHASLKHAVLWRDERRCTHRSRNGARCEESRWLDVHHRVPVSHGGRDSLENLTTLCKRHHTQLHH